MCAMNRQTKEPPKDERGACTACRGGWLCQWHKDEGLRKDAERSAVLRRVCQSIREAEIARVCSRFELESDEGGTREEKASRYLESGVFL